MLKNLSVLEHAIEGKAYQFLCDPNSPLHHVRDALVKFLSYVQQVEDQVKAAQDKLAEEQKPVEAPAAEAEQPQEEPKAE